MDQTMLGILSFVMGAINMVFGTSIAESQLQRKMEYYSLQLPRTS